MLFTFAQTINKRHMSENKPKEEFEENNYILQDNKKTKIGTSIIILALIVLILGVILSGIYFELW